MNTRIIKVDISLCKPNCEPFLFDNGRISISDDSIVVSGCLDCQHGDLFSVAYKAGIGLHDDFIKYVKYKKANENGHPITIIKEEDTRILSFKSSCMAKGYKELSWSLSKLSISYSSAKKENYIVLNLPYYQFAKGVVLGSDLPESITLTNKSHSFNLQKAGNANQTILCTENLSPNVIDAFLTHASFYFYSLCNIIQCFTNNDGKQKVTIQIPNFENTKGFTYLPELHYVSYNKKRNFETFFRQSNWNALQENEMERLKNAVYTLSRCKYCDETTEFLLLYSILDRYAGNRHSIEPYPVMRDKLAERNIDISKIGPITDSSLQKLKLYLIRDNGKKVAVDNFCKLRNYIMHFTANASIDEFLRKSNLISNMRFAVTIILLQEFGFQAISFPKEWSHLSVLNKR